MLPIPVSVRQAVSNEKKPLPGFVNRLSEQIILLDQGIQLLDLSQFTAFGNASHCFEFLERFRLGGVFVQHPNPWWAGRRGGERFEQEVPGSFRLAGRTEEKVERLSRLYQQLDTNTSTSFLL